jgi:ketosteroid isomerase-like protein
MYHAIVRRKLQKVFDDLNRGEYEGVLRGLSPRFEHVFFGAHALGGVRHSAQAYRLWFERLFRFFSDIQFEVKNILVKGWPWDTIAAVEWVDQVKTRDGNVHHNAGVHIIRFRWARVVEIRIYHDTEKLAEICRREAASGLDEAAAPQIVD